MEIRLLKYFAAVCETLNFRKAADMLHISQPSLSAAIRKLEEELDVKIFNRDTHPVTVTEMALYSIKRCAGFWIKLQSQRIACRI